MSDIGIASIRAAEETAMEAVWWVSSLGALEESQESGLIRLVTDPLLRLEEVEDEFDALFSPDALLDSPERSAYDLLRAWLRWVAAFRTDVRRIEGVTA